MGTVECLTFYGKTKQILKSKISFRPAAYAIVINDGKILLVKNRNGGKYSFPGGGVHGGEPIERSLAREVKEETGLDVEVKELVYFMENYFYYDPSDEAANAYRYFFLAAPMSFDLLEESDDLEAEKPEWKGFNELGLDMLQEPPEVLEFVTKLLE